jgi:hypothetical protein
MKHKWRVHIVQVAAALLMVQAAAGGAVAQDLSSDEHSQNGETNGAGDQGDNGPQGSCQVVDGTPYPCEQD